MNPVKPVAAILLFAMFSFCSVDSHAQLVVNDKNLNDDKELEYIQLMYFIDKGTLRPVFFVDFGMLEPEYNEIVRPERFIKPQQILINGEAISDRVTVVWVLNKMYKAGWEYMGDVVYVPIPGLDKWHTFTLRRKK